MKFQLLSKIKLLEIKAFLAFKLSDIVFIMLINVKMPTIICMPIIIGMPIIVDILTFMSIINIKLS